MYLPVPQPSPYDVRFSLFGIPVRIHVSFWLVHGLIGLLFGVIGSWMVGLAWVVCLLASMLLHELGHAVVGRCYGIEVEIFVTALYAGAPGASELFERRQRVFVIAAGPGVQLIVAGALFLVQQHLLSLPPQEIPFDLLIWVLLLYLMNLSLAVFNLLPIRPLDGWYLLQEALSRGPAPWEQDPEQWKRGSLSERERPRPERRIRKAAPRKGKFLHRMLLALIAAGVGLLIGVLGHRWWSFPTRAVLTTKGEFVAAWLSDDGRAIVAVDSPEYPEATLPYRLRLWNLETGREVGTLYQGNDLISSVTFSPDGERVAAFRVNAEKNQVFEWDRKTGAELDRFSGDGLDGTQLFYGKEGRLLAVQLATEKTIRVDTGDALAEIPDRDNILTRGTDGFQIVHSDDTLTIWDRRDGKVTASLDTPKQTTTITDVHVAPTGHVLYGTLTDQDQKKARLFVWHGTSQYDLGWPEKVSNAKIVSVTADGSLAAVEEWLESPLAEPVSNPVFFRARVVEVATGTTLRTWDNAKIARFSSDGTRLAVEERETMQGSLKVYDWPLEKPLPSIVATAIFGGIVTFVLGWYYLERDRWA